MSLTEVSNSAPEPIPSAAPVQTASSTISDASVMSSSESTTSGSDEMTYEEKYDAAQEQAKLEEEARKEAEAEAQRKAEEEARRKAEAEAQKKAEEKAQKEAEAQAQKEAEAQAQKEAEAQMAKEEAKGLKKWFQNTVSAAGVAFNSVVDFAKDGVTAVGEFFQLSASDDDSLDEIDETDIKEAEEKLDEAIQENKDKQKTEKESKADKNKTDKDKNKTDKEKGFLQKIFGINDKDSFATATVKVVKTVFQPRKLLSNAAGNAVKKVTGSETAGRIVETVINPLGAAVDKIEDKIAQRAEQQASQEAYTNYKNAREEYEKAQKEYENDKNDETLARLSKAQEVLQNTAEAHVATKGEPVEKELQDGIFQVCKYEDGTQATFIKQPDGSWKLDPASYTPKELQSDIERQGGDTAFNYLGNTYYTDDGKYYSLNPNGALIKISEESYNAMMDNYNSSLAADMDTDAAEESDNDAKEMDERTAKICAEVEKSFGEMSEETQKIFTDILDGKEVDMSNLNGKEVSQLLSSLQYVKMNLADGDWASDAVFANGAKEAVQTMVEKLTDAYNAGEISATDLNKNLAQIKFVMDKSGYIPSNSRIKEFASNNLPDDFNFKLFETLSGVYGKKEEEIQKQIEQASQGNNDDKKPDVKIKSFEDIEKLYASLKEKTDTDIIFVKANYDKLNAKNKKLALEVMSGGSVSLDDLKGMSNDQLINFVSMIEKVSADKAANISLSDEQLSYVIDKIGLEYKANPNTLLKGDITALLGRIATAKGIDYALNLNESLYKASGDKKLYKSVKGALETQAKESNEQAQAGVAVSISIGAGKAKSKTGSSTYSGGKKTTTSSLATILRSSTSSKTSKTATTTSYKIASATKNLNNQETRQYTSAQKYTNTKGTLQSSLSTVKKTASRQASSMAVNSKEAKITADKISNTIASNNKVSDNNVKQNKDLGDLQTSKQEIENNIDANNDKVESIQNGTNEIVENLSENYENAKDAYKDALNWSSNPEVTQMQNRINGISEVISNGKEQIGEYDKSISNIASQISNSNKQIASLSSSIYDCQKQLQELEASHASSSEISDMKDIISSLKNQRSEIQKEKIAFENEQTKLNKERDAVESTVRQYQRMKTDAEVELRHTKSEIIDAAYKNMRESKEALEDTKASLLKQAREQISESKNKLNSVNDDITEIDSILAENSSEKSVLEIQNKKQTQAREAEENRQNYSSRKEADKNEKNPSRFDAKDTSRYNTTVNILTQADDLAVNSASADRANLDMQIDNIAKTNSSIEDSYDELSSCEGVINDLSADILSLSNEFEDLNEKLNDPYSMSKDEVQNKQNRQERLAQNILELIKEQEKDIQRQTEILEEIEDKEQEKEKYEKEYSDSYININEYSALAYEYTSSMKNKKKQNEE